MPTHISVFGETSTRADVAVFMSLDKIDFQDFAPTSVQVQGYSSSLHQYDYNFQTRSCLFSLSSV